MPTHGMFASSHLTKKTDTANRIQRTPVQGDKRNYFFHQHIIQGKIKTLGLVVKVEVSKASRFIRFRRLDI